MRGELPADLPILEEELLWLSDLLASLLSSERRQTPTVTEPKPAAGYIRVSPGQRAQAADSIEQQRTAIERYAARSGYVVIECISTVDLAVAIHPK